MNTIKIRYGIEDITSRVPGLFPYLEFDENHVCTLHPASDSDSGCYGKIVSAIKMPNNIIFIVNGKKIIEPDTVYSYRTLMIEYYRYKDEYPNSFFIKFMENGIGRFKIDAPIDYDECVLVPEYEYYANAGRLFDEYTKIGIMCEKYVQIKEATGEVNCELECLLEKYKKMGGDIMRDYYQTKYNESKSISETYLGYADSDFNLNFNINLVSSNNDLGLLNTFLDYFDPNEEYFDGEFVIYNDRTYICKVEKHKGPWDERDFEKLSSGRTEISRELFSGTTNSQLTGFRNNKNYLDEGGNIRTPEYGVDWLWYYNIGDVGFYETTTDELNNIEIIEGKTRVTTIDSYETNLMAYGDILRNISRNQDEQTITFEYIIGAHLKAKYLGGWDDDDDNTHYCYGDFEYDDSDSHGVTYEETYSYEIDSEIYNMSDYDFGKYITNNKIHPMQNDNTNYVIDVYKKCEFNLTSNVSGGEMMVNGTPHEYNYIVSEFSKEIDEDREELVSPLIKFDYFVGIPFTPTVKNDVKVTRGNASAWERHIKLGEIKTFEDLTSYSNGGFFNLR